MYRFIFTAIILVSLFSCSTNAQKSTEIKNVIVMISDGCGYNQVAAASIYQHGAEDMQVYHKFPVVMAMSTYSVEGSYDKNKVWQNFSTLLEKPTDSAAAATAMATGTKTYNGAIGVDTTKSALKNILEVAEEKGKSTGVVTSVPLSHATPAGFVAHNPSRKNYAQIAVEMFKNSKAEVIMGAGHPLYDDNGKITEDTSYSYVGGKALWEAIEKGTVGNDADGDGQVENWKLIQTKEDFIKYKTGETPERLAGVPFVHSTLQQGRGGDNKADAFSVPFNENVPALADMVGAALNVLDNNPKGFSLMIEGGAVDWAGHGNQSGRVIEEEIDFNKAVEEVVGWVEKNSSWDETLLIVTADHETGYLTGPDSGINDKSVWNALLNNGAGKMPGMEWHSNHHSNSLVPFFAKGKGSELLKEYIVDKDSKRGDYIDNTTIAKLIKRLLGNK